MGTPGEMRKYEWYYARDRVDWLVNLMQSEQDVMAKKKEKEMLRRKPRDAVKRDPLVEIKRFRVQLDGQHSRVHRTCSSSSFVCKDTIPNRVDNTTLKPGPIENLMAERPAKDFQFLSFFSPPHVVYIYVLRRRTFPTRCKTNKKRSCGCLA